MAPTEIAREHGGYVSASQATAAGIPRRKLTEAVSRGDLVQVARGLYALPDTWEDPYLIAQHRFARGTFSDDTALFLHGLTDRAPFSLTMTFPRGYNATPAREAGIERLRDSARQLVRVIQKKRCCGVILLNTLLCGAFL